MNKRYNESKCFNNTDKYKYNESKILDSNGKVRTRLSMEENGAFIYDKTKTPALAKAFSSAYTVQHILNIPRKSKLSSLAQRKRK